METRVYLVVLSEVLYKGHGWNCFELKPVKLHQSLAGNETVHNNLPVVTIKNIQPYFFICRRNFNTNVTKSLIPLFQLYVKHSPIFYSNFT